MILIVDDDIAVRTSLTLLLKRAGQRCKGAEDGNHAMHLLNKEQFDLVIMDMNFTVATSGRDGLQLIERIKEINATIPIIMMTGWGTIDLAIKGMKAGAMDFITKPWENDRIIDSVTTHININKPKRVLKGRKGLDGEYDFSNIIGEDPALLDVLQTVGRISDTTASVLVTGESGTGKELIAEAIHLNSKRIDNEFIKVNLGGISTSLFESEMFGHKKGAFTDAHSDRVGRFEIANNGTIFLDEIGDLDPSSQVKLLRVLQEQKFEVLGSSQTKNVNVRVISATNKDLESMVQEGTFREDLYYRINLITVKLPALRDRPGDIPLLANHFVNNLKELYNRPNLAIDPDALRWMKKLPLPGNIRQLKNMVERTVLVSVNDNLGITDFEKWATKGVSVNQKLDLPDVGAMTLEEVEKNMIIKAMMFHNSRISRVAKALGITRSSLYRRLEKYDIPYDT